MQLTKGYSPFLSFNVDDMDSTVVRLLSMGAELDGPIKYPPQGKVTGLTYILKLTSLVFKICWTLPTPQTFLATELDLQLSHSVSKCKVMKIDSSSCRIRVEMQKN